MHPVLIEFPSGFFLKGLHTYGLMMVLGYCMALLIHLREGKPYRWKREFILDTAMWGVLCGIAGSRVLYVLTQWRYFSSHPSEIVAIWEGGFVVYGGIISVLGYFYYVAKKRKINPLDVYDVFVPGFALAHAFGRVGCLFAGCCYGRPTDVPWAIKFPEGAIAPAGVPLHPTQLYEVFSNLIIFSILLFVRRKFKNDEIQRRTRSGIVIGVYLILYSIMRSIIEIYRGDSIRGFIIEDVLSTSQFISIFILGVGVALVMKALKRNPEQVAKRK